MFMQYARNEKHYGLQFDLLYKNQRTFQGHTNSHVHYRSGNISETV